MSKTKSPKYRKQSSRKGERAFVELNGVRHYLGEYGSAESRQEYHRLLAEWSASGQQFPVAQNEITVVELISRFWEHAKTYYVRPDGTHTSEISNFKRSLKILKETYALRQANEFGPLALRAVREKMIALGWVRKSINNQIGRILSLSTERSATIKFFLFVQIHIECTAYCLTSSNAFQRTN